VPEGDLLLSRKAAQFIRRTARLDAASPHQRQHLQHTVVDVAREPLPLSRRGGERLGLGPRVGCLEQQAGAVADDARGEEEQEDVGDHVGIDDRADRQISH
jgi:hypothetical protein